MTWGPFDLTGRAAIVTGAAMGIGFACATRLAEAGADVVLADIDGDALEPAAARISGSVSSVRVDVADPDAPAAMVEHCVGRFGRLDVLVNNAGIFPWSPLTTLTGDLLQRVLAVNVVGVMMATQAAANRMIGQGGGGVIVNLASPEAFKPSTVGMVAYGTAKGAVVSFTRHAALELAPHGIRVVAVAPGAVPTEGVRRSLRHITPEQRASMSGWQSRLPLGRFTQPDEIATVVAFLASDAAAMVTGDTVLADGGALLS